MSGYSQVNRAVSESFQLWQQHIRNLDFKEELGAREADIKIYFEKGEHGDGEPFELDSVLAVFFRYAAGAGAGGGIRYSRS